MAKALFALALWLCTSFSVYAAAPPKKPPTWAELSAEQQQVLAPLAADWNNIEPLRQSKWLGIAKRYPTMQPDEQARVQKRMQAWAKLTPEERRAARERYKKLEKLPPDKKQALKQKWEEYNQLPEQERRKLGGVPAKSPPAAGQAAKPVPAPAPAPLPLRPRRNKLPQEGRRAGAAVVTGTVPGIGRRLASLVYETLVVAAIALFAASIYPGAASGRLSGMALILFQLYLVLVLFAYFLWCWRRSGQTLPMKAWRLRLLAADGGAVTVRQSVARYLIGLAAFGTSIVACVALWRGAGEHAWIVWIAAAPGPAALAWALVDPERQFLHDRLAGTRVVMERAP